MDKVKLYFNSKKNLDKARQLLTTPDHHLTIHCHNWYDGWVLIEVDFEYDQSWELKEKIEALGLVKVFCGKEECYIQRCKDKESLRSVLKLIGYQFEIAEAIAEFLIKVNFQISSI